MDRTNEYFIFTNRETGADLVPAASELPPRPERGPREEPSRADLWEQLKLPAAGLRGRVNVLFSPGFTSPLRCACPRVSVFHDLQHQRHPEFFRPWELPFWNWFLAQSARTSERLIAVSQATADDLERFYPGPARRRG